MPINVKIFCIALLIVPDITFPQNDERPFKKLYDNHGLIVSFIFYSEGDGEENNGVVIYLENKNDHNISFQFTLIFRAGVIDRARTVDGTMIPREKRTGSNDGLYFLPFDDKSSIAEVGIRKVKVIKLE